MNEAKKYFFKSLIIIAGWIVFLILGTLILILINKGDGFHIFTLLFLFILGLFTHEFLHYNKNKDAIKSERKLYDAEQKIIEQARYRKEIEKHNQ